MNCTIIKPTCAVHWQWGGWRGRWRSVSGDSHVIRGDSCDVSARQRTWQAPHAAGGRCQDGDVSVPLLVDLDGALFLQFVDLFLQVALSLDGLVLLLQHLPQCVYLRAGVFVDFLWRRGELRVVSKAL